MGATRVFRLHRKLRLDLFGGAAGGSSSLHAAAAAGAGITRIDAPLPHNTLVIMWPPCQEAWKHEVGGWVGERQCTGRDRCKVVRPAGVLFYNLALANPLPPLP